jgi:hypothetical protein
MNRTTRSRTAPPNRPMRRSPLGQAVAWAVIGGFSVGITSQTRAAEPATEEVKVLRVENDIRKEQSPNPVLFRIRSQRPYNAKQPWVERSIKPGGTVEIRLKSPDQFIAEIRHGRWSYKTSPMPLKRALGEDSSRVLSISQIVFGPDPYSKARPEVSVWFDNPQPGHRRSKEQLDVKSEKQLHQRLKPENASRVGSPGGGVIRRWRGRRRR